MTFEATRADAAQSGADEQPASHVATMIPQAFPLPPLPTGEVSKAMEPANGITARPMKV